MSDLSAVSTTSLERLAHAARSGRLSIPLTQADLVAIGIREQRDAITAALEGHSRTAVTSILDAVLAERSANSAPPPELVWTGPESTRASARDTAVVLRELFESARSHVVLAGYSFERGEAVLRPLAESLRTHGIRADIFVRVEQAQRAVPNPEAYMQDAMSEFIQKSWPFGPPYPNVYCDRRAGTTGPPWSDLHAKCVSIDGERALVSSANFTDRGHDRNIETGVLLHDKSFARYLERQWMSLIDARLVVRWEG